MLQRDSHGEFSRAAFPTRPSMLSSRAQQIGVVAATMAAIGVGALTLNSCWQYTDLPGFSGKTSQGRTKNALAAAVAGIVAEKIAPNSVIDLEIQKFWYPDAHVEGRVQNGSISTHVPLAFTSATFKAEDHGGQISGTVEKSEFDWDIKQTGPESWEIGRALMKFDHALNLSVKDGRVNGELVRIMGANWKIDGSYTPLGEVEIRIDAPLTLGITLRGRVISTDLAEAGR
jgi:hypothetical protein